MAGPPPYKNGFVPVNWLVVIARGYNGIDGNWEHRLPRATLERWYRLVARAARRRADHGLPALELRISSGWCTDRPYAAQVTAKQIHGNLAATPGTSSHGGIFEGKRTAAIDAGNYAAVYTNCGGYDAWLSDLRAEGFDRLPAGYPLDGERHHIIDYHCWDDVAETAGNGSTPFNPEEEDMSQQDVNDIKATVANIERILVGASDAVTKDDGATRAPALAVAKRLGGALSIVPLTEEGIFLFSHVTGKRAHITDTYHISLLERVIRNNNNDTMLWGELDIVEGYIAQIAPA